MRGYMAALARERGLVVVAWAGVVRARGRRRRTAGKVRERAQLAALHSVLLRWGAVATRRSAIRPQP